MKASALLLLCGLCLAASGIARAQLDAGDGGLAFVPRFTRLLKQDLSSVATFLLPTKLPARCIGSACCQADSYASPYQLKFLNSSQTVIGGRTYTTFFYNFNRGVACRADLDDAGCCGASANTIWVDVDPTLKVKFVAFDGHGVVSSEQTEFGLKIAGLNRALGSIPAAGVAMTVTVEGAASVLCPPPGLAPLPGLCELVVEGAPSAGSAKCCPLSVSRTSAETFIPPANAFTCNADVAASAFKLEFMGVSAPRVHASSGDNYVDYSFHLAAPETCSRASVNHCCDAQLEYLELRMTAQTVLGVLLNNQEVAHSTSAWNEPNSASYRSLLVDNLNLVADDLGPSGMSLTVRVRLPAGASSVDLCDADPSNAAQGMCSYYLHSTDGVCCPSGLALPSTAVPPVPPGVCNTATTAVPPTDLSALLSYYERSSTAATTTFGFLLANHNGASCTKPHCEDVCGWTLYVTPAAAAQAAIGHDDAAYNDRHVIVPGGGANGAPASISFTYGPSGESTNNFFLTLPNPAAYLTDLCAANVLPNQNGKACAAIVRTPHVYAMVYFDDSDMVLEPIASPPMVGPSLCPNASPLSSSCLGVRSARFNAQPASTVVDFSLDLSGGGQCLRAAPAGQSVLVRLLLSAAAVDQISTRMAVVPSTGLSLDRVNGAAWSLAQGRARLAFQLQGAMAMADVCRQGVTLDQPANSCVVEISGASGCFRGFVAATADGRLVWVGAESGGGGINTSVVVPAIVVPIACLLAALAAAAIWYRRRRQQGGAYRQSSLSGSAGELERPLAGDAPSRTGSQLQRDDLSVPSAAPSDVHIRVPGASQGGTRQ